jgi:hypothetical protein
MPRILTMLFAALVLQTAPPIYLPIVNQPPPTPTVAPTSTPLPTAVATIAPTATTAPTATAQPTPTATPNPSAPCPCQADTLNCGDFATQPEAQACFDHCMATVGSDIHGLDRGNSDGIACESLPRFWRYLTFPAQN